jgi:hypothetical protein
MFLHKCTDLEIIEHDDSLFNVDKTVGWRHGQVSAKPLNGDDKEATNLRRCGVVTITAAEMAICCDSEI